MKSPTLIELEINGKQAMGKSVMQHVRLLESYIRKHPNQGRDLAPLARDENKGKVQTR